MQISDNDILFETIVSVSIIRHHLSPAHPPHQCVWLYAKMQIIHHCLAVFNNNAIMPMNHIDSAHVRTQQSSGKKTQNCFAHKVNAQQASLCMPRFGA